MLTSEEIHRYVRQLPVWGEEGQEKLKKSRVLVAGAGGLGTVIATYLAMAGTGVIRIVDSDVVEGSNLNRQFLYTTSDVGRKKAACIQERLSALNPHVRIEAIGEEIDARSAGDMVGSMDVMVDGLDNFFTRYLLNREALRRNIPLIHGAVRGFYGQVTTILPYQTPCFQCIFPSAAPQEDSPVVGATCGVIGSIEATEAIKFLTGQGELLTGRLLMWNGLTGEADILKLERNPACPECGDSHARDH
jgi:adenylyltransferase/sulfurtransferase